MSKKKLPEDKQALMRRLLFKIRNTKNPRLKMKLIRLLAEVTTGQ